MSSTELMPLSKVVKTAAFVGAKRIWVAISLTVAGNGFSAMLFFTQRQEM